MFIVVLLIATEFVGWGEERPTDIQITLPAAPQGTEGNVISWKSQTT
ncbi:hypothetical protein [Rhodococcus sp. 24CO]